MVNSNRPYTEPLNPEAIRKEAVSEGGVDPFLLRFRVVEYAKSTGERLGVLRENVGFIQAWTETQEFLSGNHDSHFCLEAVGYLQ